MCGLGHLIGHTCIVAGSALLCCRVKMRRYTMCVSIAHSHIQWSCYYQTLLPTWSPFLGRHPQAWLLGSSWSPCLEPALHPKVSSHTPYPDLTPADANSNTCALQGTEDHIALNMRVGINLIAWVQNNVNGAIIMHMLPLRSPIKPKHYWCLAYL